MRIQMIRGREVLDSRGNPTVEVDCILASGEVGRAIAVVEEVGVNDLAQFRMRASGRSARDREHRGHAGIVQALEQRTRSHHAGRAEQDDVHMR